MKIASGAASPASAAGAAPSTTSSRRHAEGRGVAADAGRALGAALDGDRAHRPDRRASIRCAIEPAPAPMSHSSSPRRGASARQRHGAHLALGDLAVVLEQIVGQARRARQERARRPSAATSMRDRVERVDIGRCRMPPRVALRMRSRGPPIASSTVSRERAEAASRPGARRAAAGASPSQVSARTRAPGCRCGRTRSSARPCSDSERGVLQAPSRAAPRRG